MAHCFLIPLVSGLEKLLKTVFVEDADPSEVYRYFRRAIMDRLGQLEGPGNRGGSPDRPCHHYSASMKSRRRRPGASLALPGCHIIRRVNSKEIRKSGWRSMCSFTVRSSSCLGSLESANGAAATLERQVNSGEKIDWFDKKPEPEPAPKKDTDEFKDGSGGSDRDFEADGDKDQGLWCRSLKRMMRNSDGACGVIGRRTRTLSAWRPRLDRYPRRPFPHQEEAVLWLSRHAERCGKPARWEEGKVLGCRRTPSG